MSEDREPVEVVHWALRQPFADEEGEPITIALLPGLSDQELEAMRASLPGPLPADLERLLRLCRGVEGTSAAEALDFTGKELSCAFPDMFPHGLPIAGDGWGNYWFLDPQPAPRAWPVYFVCHDPPITLFQSASLAEFLTEVFKMDIPPHQSLVDDVHEDRLFDVWGKQPGLIAQEQAATSADPVLRAFAEQVGAAHVLVDLRDARPGQGFAWGRYAGVVRHGELPIFALRKKRGVLGWLLGR